MMRTFASAIFILFHLFSIGKCAEKSCPGAQFRCGQRPIEHPSRNDENYSGAAYPGQWPWIGIVYHRRQSDLPMAQYACSGTLISDRHVLTSMLCVAGENGTVLLSSEDVFFRIGTHRRNFFNFGYARHRRVSRIHQPTDFEQEGSKNELVILELNERVTFNDYVQPGCIGPDFNFFFYRGHFKRIIGWGLAEGHEDHLGNYNSICPTRFQLNGSFVCEKDRGAVVLKWDHENSPSRVLFGIVDCVRPTSCEQNNKQGFIRIENFIPWIAQTTNLEYLRTIRKGQPFDPTKRYRNLLPQRHCGNNFISINETSSTAQLYEFPWIANIFRTHVEFLDEPMCQGSLISHRYVLTAALCGHLGAAYFVRLGEYDTGNNPDCSKDNATDCAPPFRDYDVEYQVNHPNYESQLGDNIALIRTKKTILFEDHIQPICLPVSQEWQQKKFQQYVKTGWRKPHNKILQKEFVQLTECDSLTQMANFGDAVVCIIESSDYVKIGSPLIAEVAFKGRQRYVQYGLWIGGLGNPQKYATISPHMNWIIANMEE